MSRRQSDVSMLCCPLTVRERLICDDMRKMTGLHSDADLGRLGLWHLAKHLDQRLDADVFALRHGTEGQAIKPRRNVKVSA
jgi:hypothetical protein